MRKNLLYLLSVFMTLALGGIILVQYYWIRNAVELETDRFKSGVWQALGEIITELERREWSERINQRLQFSYSLRERGLLLPGEELYLFEERQAGDLSIIVGQRLGGGTPPLRVPQETAPEKEKAPPVPLKPANRQMPNDRNGKWSISDSIDSGGFLAGSLRRPLADDSASEQDELRTRALFDEVFQQIVRESRTHLDPLRGRLGGTDLKSLISAELRRKGIDANFEYAIYDGFSDTITPYRSAGFGGQAAPLVFDQWIFPHDFQDKQFYLKLTFANPARDVLRSLRLLVLGSVVFTLVILGVFVFSLLVILRQRKLSEVKSDFINNMTHELKTPLATISVAAKALRTPKVMASPDKALYFADKIQQENDRMNQLIENLLQMARIERNDFSMNLQPVDLHELVEVAVGSLSLQVESRGGLITLELLAQQSIVEVDPVHLSNVLFNLLDNANKYSPEIPEIHVRTSNPQPGWILVEVSDKGIGMDRDTQAKAFEKFYRETTGNIHNVKGFGLGLSYVKAMVEVSRGKVELRSKPGEGSTFGIRLPLPPARNPEA